MTIVVWEGDELLMQTCMAVTERKYSIVFRSGKEHPLGREYYTKGKFDHSKVIKRMTKLNKIKDIHYSVKLDCVCEDINKAIFFIQREIRKMYWITSCERIDLWVGPSDGSNFRFKSAVTKPYKGNREDKPKIHAQLKQYLIDVCGAQVMHGYEADDALGIHSGPDRILVHCDKDIGMIPGMHYDTIRNIFYEVDDLGYLYLSTDGKSLKGIGKAFFYAQLIMGDRTDNIPSIPHHRYKGWGAKLTYEVLRNCKDEKEYFDTVISVYKESVGSNWLERLMEQADLVWICRKHGEYGSHYLEQLL